MSRSCSPLQDVSESCCAIARQRVRGSQGLELLRYKQDLESGVIKVAKGEKILQPVPVELIWTDISYQVQPAKMDKDKERKPKVVLHTCNGLMSACEAVAIMGPSGAGTPSGHSPVLMPGCFACCGMP